ncbi:MAG: S41 family peptidase [Flavobacteriia bacterium]|nr:S41 family peptidase [Flavobacteriia bacterium]NBV91162.1 S41 family peptidase [Flavobacteriia bacterium]
MRNLLFIAFVTALSTVFAQQNPNTLSTGIKFQEIITQIEANYVDAVDSKKLTETAIIAMLEKLDPHSTYIPAEEANEAQSQINGSFVGIGIRFQIVKDTLMVVATIPGGPSEKLGILAGDQIVAVDGKIIAGVKIKNDDVRAKLMGELGSKVEVQILRKKTASLKFNITRDKIPIYSVDSYYMVNKEVGYIKLNSFSRTTVEEMQNALKFLKSKGMKSLIFDLQGNGGGLLDAARGVADEFLSGNKLLVYSEGRSQPRSNLQASRKGLWEEGGLIVLTDEYSASASEIVSGALQDWDRALIVGRRTFGKGLVQRPITLSDGSEIRLTIARYYTPTGRFIQKPYSDVENYRKDLTERYLNGEFQHADSIKLPDSLKFTTLNKKRFVYGGGGIMPDVFVALDTTDVTDYFNDLVRGGHVNSFSLQYVNNNRETLKKTYPSFDVFLKSFATDENFMKEFFAYVEKEDPKLTMVETEYATSAKSIQIRIKSNIAQDLFGFSESYQIFNQMNEMVNKGIQLFNSKEYDVFDLAD